MEEILRQAMRQPPLVDDGFTPRVLSEIPERRLWRPTASVGAICLGGAIGGALAFAQERTLVELGDGLVALADFIGRILDHVADPMVSVGWVAVAGALCFAYWDELRRKYWS